MISVDIQAVNSEFINWQALVDKVLVGEKVVILKSGIEVAEIAQKQEHVSNEDIFGFTQGDIKIHGDIISATTTDDEWNACQ